VVLIISIIRDILKEDDKKEKKEKKEPKTEEAD